MTEKLSNILIYEKAARTDLRLVRCEARHASHVQLPSPRTVDRDSRRAVGPTKTIRGVLVYMTQLNRLQRLAALSAFREWSFYA